MTPEETPTPQDAANPTSPQDAGKVEDLPEFAQELIKKLRGENKERRLAVEQAEKERQRLETERLQEQGKFKELFEETSKRMPDLESKAAQTEAYEQWFKDTLAARLKAVPAHIRTLLEAQKPMDALRWLEDNASELARNPGSRSNLDGQAKGADMAVASLTAEEITMAQRFGMTLEQYAIYKTKGAITRDAPKDK